MFLSFIVVSSLAAKADDSLPLQFIFDDRDISKLSCRFPEVEKLSFIFNYSTNARYTYLPGKQIISGLYRPLQKNPEWNFVGGRFYLEFSFKGLGNSTLSFLLNFSVLDYNEMMKSRLASSINGIASIFKHGLNTELEAICQLHFYNSSKPGY